MGTKRNNSYPLLLIVIISPAIVFYCLKISFQIRQYTFNGILSDSSFKISTEYQPGWTLDAFDDSHWDFACAPYWEGYEIPLLKRVKIPNLALPIWSADRKPIVFFRKSFHLDSIPKDKVFLSIRVDDTFELSINGKQLSKECWERMQDGSDIADVAGYLKQGRNILAVKGINNALAANLILYLPIPDGNCSRNKPVLPIFTSFLMLIILIGFLRFLPLISRIRVPGNTSGSRYPVHALILLTGWAAWTAYFRHFPLYKMSPTIVTSHFFVKRLFVFLLTGTALLIATILRFRDANTSRRNKTSRKVYLISILGIILLSAGLRLIKYQSIPPGIFQDDASFMLAGERLIMQKQITPWIDDMNGNGTLMIYWDGIVSLLVRNKLLALRLAPALVGILTIALIPWVFQTILTRRQILFFMGIMAISHYHINYSRIPWDQITVPLFSMLSVFFLLRGLQSTSHRTYFIISGVALGLGLYGYAGFRALPPIIAGIVLLNRETLKAFRQRQGIRYLVLPFILTVFPLGKYLLQHQSKFLQRTSLVDIFPTMTRYFDLYPAWIQTMKTFLMFTFIGDGVTPRHNTPGTPVFGYVGSAFFYMGLAVLLSNGNTVFRAAGKNGSRISKSLLWWIAFGAFISSLTFEAPHFSRSINLQIPIFLIAGLGLWFVDSQLRVWKIRRWGFRITALSLMLAWNWQVYFVRKLEARDVYSHCGYIALKLDENVRRIRREDGKAIILVGPSMNYITSCAMQWLHPEIVRFSDYTIDSAARLRDVQTKFPTRVIHVFIRSGNSRFLAELRRFRQYEWKQTVDGFGSVIFYEVIIDPRIKAPDVKQMPAMQPGKVEPGLIRTYYSDTFCSGKPRKSGIGYLHGFHWPDDDHKPFKPPIGICWEGFLKIDNPGIYDFFLSSDDGSTLVIDDVMVVDNSGEHGYITRTGRVNLAAGFHSLHVHYDDMKWNAEFKLTWIRPDSSEQEEIPEFRLFHRDKSPAGAPSPTP